MREELRKTARRSGGPRKGNRDDEKEEENEKQLIRGVFSNCLPIKMECVHHKDLLICLVNLVTDRGFLLDLPRKIEFTC